MNTRENRGTSPLYRWRCRTTRRSPRRGKDEGWGRTQGDPREVKLGRGTSTGMSRRWSPPTTGGHPFGVLERGTGKSRRSLRNLKSGTRLGQDLRLSDLLTGTPPPDGGILPLLLTWRRPQHQTTGHTPNSLSRGRRRFVEEPSVFEPLRPALEDQETTRDPRRQRVGGPLGLGHTQCTGSTRRNVRTEVRTRSRQGRGLWELDQVGRAPKTVTGREE